MAWQRRRKKNDAGTAATRSLYGGNRTLSHHDRGVDERTTCSRVDRSFECVHAVANGAKYGIPQLACSGLRVYVPDARSYLL